MSFKYNDDGIRTQKTVNGTTTTYRLAGDKVTYETDGTDSIYYTYSGDDIISMNLNGTEYYYIKNNQNDIIGIIDNSGSQVVSYVYDSWGKLISTSGSLAATVGAKNPYRYRCYRYDTETGLYYLQSRYYNPEWGRFINADVVFGLYGILLSHNLFAYCLNNPINFIDMNGYYVITYIENDWALGPRFLKATVVGKASSRLIDFLASYESFKSKPYNAGDGRRTIGYGHVIKKGESYTSITMLSAKALLLKDIQIFVNGVNKLTMNISLSSQKFDALVSLAFNIGIGGLSRSDLLKNIKNGSSNSVIKRNFLSYCYVKSKRSLGLWRRRMDEWEIYSKGDYTRNYPNW